MLYDALIRKEYYDDGPSKSLEIYVQIKNLSAETINTIIQEYGTKYQSLTPAIYDSIIEILSGEDRSFALFYGPLKFISLQNIFYLKECATILNLLKQIMVSKIMPTSVFPGPAAKSNLENAEVSQMPSYNPIVDDDDFKGA